VPIVRSDLSCAQQTDPREYLRTALKRAPNRMVSSKISAAVGAYRNRISTHLRVTREAGLLPGKPWARDILYEATPMAALEMLRAIEGSNGS
jgi:hypothetical protein